MNDIPTTAFNFFRFGISTNVSRYQTPAASSIHRLLCGSTEALNVSGTSATFASTLQAGGNITISTGSNTGQLIFANTSGNNSIQVDNTNNINFAVNTTNWLSSNGTTSTMRSDLTMTNISTESTKRLTIDCPIGGGTPYLTMKARNTATAEISLTSTF